MDAVHHSCSRCDVSSSLVHSFQVEHRSVMTEVAVAPFPQFLFRLLRTKGEGAYGWTDPDLWPPDTQTMSQFIVCHVWLVVQVTFA